MTSSDRTEQERERFAQLVAVASALASARRWESAGRAWIDAARFAIEAGAIPSARTALDAAGEAFRRDDRLKEATDALQSVLTLDPTPEESSLVAIRLASIAGERGQAADGLEQLRRVSVDAPAVRAMALDTEIGLLWSLGRKADVQQRLSRLVALAEAQPVLGAAARFREAQLRRVDGQFDRTEQILRALSAEMRGREGSDAAIAAIRSELAETDLLRGQTAAAIDGYSRARELHETAGRRSLAFGAEGGRVRAALYGGLHIIDTILEEGLTYATERGLLSLSIELRIALGMLLSSRGASEGADVLKTAIGAAHSAGMRLTAGRARLELATYAAFPPEHRISELDIAICELEGHIPLQQRAIAARERAQPPR